MDDQVMILPDGTSLVLIHYLYLAPAGLLQPPAGDPLPGVPPAASTYKLACEPRMAEFSMSAGPTGRAYPWRRTDEPRAVTCPNCKSSKVWVEAMENIDRVLGVKPAKGKVGNWP